MSDNKKYYYLKLKDNFFESEEMVILESMPDGIKYSNILLKLYLKSLKNEGKLMFKERIPYNPMILATLTRHSVGDVEKALKVFKELNLIEIMDNGAIYMLDIQNFIGKSTTEADRKRLYRAKIEDYKLNCGQLTEQISDKTTPELRDRDKEIELDNNTVKKRKTKRFSKPTVSEVKIYCSNRENTVDAEKFVNYYESKGWMIGKNKMKDWKAAVRTWEGNSYNSSSTKRVKTSRLSQDIYDDYLKDNPNCEF